MSDEQLDKLHKIIQHADMLESQMADVTMMLHVLKMDIHHLIEKRYSDMTIEMVENAWRRPK